MIPGMRRWLDVANCLACEQEDLGLSPENPCKKAKCGSEELAQWGKHRLRDLSLGPQHPRSRARIPQGNPAG